MENNLCQFSGINGETMQSVLSNFNIQNIVNSMHVHLVMYEFLSMNKCFLILKLHTC